MANGSPPIAGEGLGVGLIRFSNNHIVNSLTPPPTPPRKRWRGVANHGRYHQDHYSLHLWSSLLTKQEAMSIILTHPQIKTSCFVLHSARFALI